MRKTMKKVIVLLLAVMLCTGLCTDFAVRAEEGDAITKDQPEQAEADRTEDVLTEEEPAASETEDQESGQEQYEPETDEMDIAPDAQEIPEESSEDQGELGQPEEQVLMTTDSGASLGLENPRIEQEGEEISSKVVTWDCVYFGSYPQSKVLSSSPVYNTLKNADWKNKNEIEVGEDHYCRISKDTYSFQSDDNGNVDTFYDWSESGYHYFKYEPIKWRVLSVAGEKVLLLSDIVLDCQQYGNGKSSSWGDSTINRWLNDNFRNSAFTETQKSAIKIPPGGDYEVEPPGEIFLLEADDLTTDSYGFAAENIQDEARRCLGSIYAWARGLKFSSYEGAGSSCAWWVASLSADKKDENKHVRYVDVMGEIDRIGTDASDHQIGVRPALWANLSSLLTDEWEKAGTKSSDKWSEGGFIGGDNNNGSNTGGNNSGSGTTSGKTVKVSGITLSGISRKIAAGKKIQLTASIQPSNASDKSLTWQSSNNSVATVDSKGVVILKKNTGGKTVTITATAKDGSGKKATYKITSMKGVVKKIKITGGKTRKVKAGKKVSLKAKVTASNSKKANKKLKWTSSNTKYATVTSTGKVKTKKAGKGKSVKITAAATDGSGKKKSVTIKIR